MFRALNVAATGMAAQETQLDTIANNLANANTTGYKTQRVEFEDMLYQNARAPGPNASGNVTPTAVQVGTGVRILATARTFTQGTLQQTGNQLDIAIEGQGFLPVTQASGEVAYTRAGSLKLDAQGRLATSDGLLLSPPISIPTTATSVTIAADGTVSVVQQGSTASTSAGQIQLASFPNPNGLTSIGHNLFIPSSASGDATTGAPATNGLGTIQQGSIEASNVDVVNEMVAMIQAQRSYEINSKVISAADEMLRDATQNQ